LSRVEVLKNSRKVNYRFKQDLQRRYWLEQKGYVRVPEEMKQRLQAKATKIKRYNDRIEQFRQNNLFRTDQSRLFKEFNGK